jgi:hypothetical protein
MASTVTAQTTKDGAAKVVRIKGTARYSTGNNVWQPLSVGDVLRPGNVIQTDRDAGSYVDIVLGDGKVPTISPGMASAGALTPGAGGYPATATAAPGRPVAQQNTVRLFDNTVLGIDKLSATETGADLVTDTQLDLRSGHIVGNVRKMTGASRYEVKLPNGVAGIRGTIYHIWADGRIQVAEGTVVLSLVDAQGNVQTRVINAGYEYNPRTDQIIQMAPGQVSAMLSASSTLFTAGTVYLNTINANPDMILNPITPDRTLGVEVSPTGGNGGNGDGDGDGEPEF